MRSSNISGPSFKIFDAVIESNEAEDHTDPEMEKFERLLRDYLNGAYPIFLVRREVNELTCSILSKRDFFS